MLALATVPYRVKTSPTSSGLELVNYEDLYEPVQVGLEMEPFRVEVKGNGFTLYPVAGYTVYARVLGKKNYYLCQESKLSPTDLALAWGGMMGDELQPYVSYRQSNRWYYYRYGHDFPYDHSFIATQTANKHIIPSNRNLRNKLRKIKKGDEIVLYGYLVNYTYTVNGTEVRRDTSLTRTDTGSGACEIIYVTRINHKGRVYE